MHFWNGALELWHRAFVRKLADAFGGDETEPAATRRKEGQGPFDHAVMNLPASAPEFTDAFIGLGRVGLGEGSRHWSEERLPWVHCYCFAKGADAAACHGEVAARLDTAMAGLSGCVLSHASASRAVAHRALLRMSTTVNSSDKDLLPLELLASCAHLCTFWCRKSSDKEFLTRRMVGLQAGGESVAAVAA